MLLCSYPAKAGGEATRSRSTASRVAERTQAVPAGRRGWGGVASDLLLFPKILKSFRAKARVTFFAGTKKVTKEMPWPRSTARSFIATSIFRLGILPRSENGAHPVRRPSGLWRCQASSCYVENKAASRAAAPASHRLVQIIVVRWTSQERSLPSRFAARVTKFDAPCFAAPLSEEREAEIVTENKCVITRI